MNSDPLWRRTPANIWQGRDDSLESPRALRVFQTITQKSTFDFSHRPTEEMTNQIALLGFMCDDGVRLNKGRMGARNAPNAIRSALANLASHPAQYHLTDFGNIECLPDQLDIAQQSLTQHIKACHQHQFKTLVLGGGHETAFAHGLGLYEAYPDAKIGIINFDAHLDLRTAPSGTSGTPFKQLADYCEHTQRPFEYMCVGVSLAANTQTLLDTANALNVRMILDTDCYETNLVNIQTQIQNFIDTVDIIYLTIDLDVLSPSHMFAVSAPAALGLEMRTVLALGTQIAHSPKLRALDLVEYNPEFDSDQLCAKVAARIAWQLCQHW